jgi:ketosteroid isomerase-like protein
MVEHPNISIVKRIGSAIQAGDIGGARDVLGEEVVWHYFNPRLPELAGDYVGIAGIAAFFESVARRTGGTFRVEPVSANSAGDELVVTHARLHLTLDTRQIQTDALVVWRLHNHRVVEVWDIPAVHAPPAAGA